MKRILVLTSFIFGLVLSPVTWAQPSHVVMLLWRGTTDAERGFMDYLKSQRDVRFTLLNANGDKASLQQNIAQLTQLKPDLVYSFGTTITLALLGTHFAPSEFAQQKIAPVVFSVVTDPVGSQLTEKLDQGHELFTGVTHIVPLSTQLNTINMLGDINRIGVIFNPLESNSSLVTENMVEMGAQYKKSIFSYSLSVVDGKPDPNSVAHIAKLMKKHRIQMAYLPPDSFIITQGKSVIEQLHQAGIPTFSATETPIRDHQALLGVVGRYYSVGQFAGFKAEQILSKRYQPTEIAIEGLSQYSYIVNLSAAESLDYYPPISVLKIAEVIGK
ncbi:ABC transporter substrate binding protein [Motilimonas cestriensis]|uniref:ABC transporter substrate binding protein n=1 Tax=Motilimonas cestriensis TaxID=2742685 RepID=UPI003DA4D98B